VKSHIGSEVYLLSSYLPVQWNDVKYIRNSYCTAVAGLKITAGQRTMSGLIEALTRQMFDLPVMLTGQNWI